MRKKGSVCEFTIQRDEELKSVFRRIFMSRKSVSAESLFGEVVMSEASRFFVSEVRAERMIRHHLKRGVWPVKSVLRRRMFTEIENRVMQVLASEGVCIAISPDNVIVDIPRFRDVICEVVNSPAPSFYLTPRSCRTLLYGSMSKRNRIVKFSQNKVRV